MTEIVRGGDGRRKSGWHSGRMPESAAEVYARALEAAGPDGRLPMPPLAGWDVFPWECADGALVPKRLREPSEDGPREGEGGRPCPACEHTLDAAVVWEDDFWVLRAAPEPSGLPLVLTLWTREHLDFGDLGDELASQLGRISNRLVRIIQGLPNIGRVHVNRWGDGSAHLHVWFFARPAGLASIKGSYAVEWDDILPPGPDDVRRADLHAVAVKLENWGGHARA
jgi:diadenosine tetraphosphate (Ap4A) HIT family hydrolase